MLMNSNQRFGTLVKPARRAGRVKEINYLEVKDKQMRFNNAKDPIYYVFDCIENRPVSTLAKEFVKDSVFEVMNFVSRVVG